MYECMEEWFEWEYKGKVINLHMDDIYYFCSEERKTYIHAKNGVYQIGTTVKTEEEKMRKLPFIRTHNAYLVHLKHLECIGRQEAVIRNGDRVPVSERREQQAKQQMRIYWKQMRIAKKQGKATIIRGICPACLKMSQEYGRVFVQPHFDSVPVCQPSISYGNLI